MTQIDIEPTSPQSSPERHQLDRINTAIDETLSQLETTSQHVQHALAHVVGMKWYQKTTHEMMSYQRWRERQQQLSKLTYTCGGIDEALMRHLFSLDAIMGDDSIRILRRAAVHRIKHAITRVEILTKYMYKIQYWWKKWIKHESEQQQQSQDQTVTMEPATPTHATSSTASTASSTAAATASPVMKSTKLPSKSPQASSRAIPSSPKLTKAAKAKKSLQKSTTKSPATKSSTLQMKSPSLQPGKSPALRPTSAKTTTRSPALAPRNITSSPALTSRGITSSPASTSRNITSASPSPLLPKRHISIPTQPVRPPPSSPRFHVQTQSDGLVITATLPDVQRDSLDITVRGHLLRIAGVSQGEPFLREMELPENADVDQLDASWQQDADVLRIEVPFIRKQPPPPPQPTRHVYDDDDMDVDEYHPYNYQKPSPYRCAPSYSRPTYPRRPVYTHPPRSMFGSPFGFW